MPIRQLHPDRFSAMSGKMAAIVGYIVGEAWTEPEIAALSVTSDGFVLTDAEFFGEAADLDRNLLNLSFPNSRPTKGPSSSVGTEHESTGAQSCLGQPRPRNRLTRPDFGAGDPADDRHHRDPAPGRLDPR